MFKIYDLDMKEIPFPDGVMPLEIFVGSISKERVTEAVDGRSGVVDYGFNYTDRPVSLFLRIKAKDKIDFRLLRNEVFATFDVGSAFYVAESDVPSRVLKVVVDESYIPDRLTEEYADFDINCRTLDSVFWESTYTTRELHDSGYSATAEKYGLVDNIDDEKVQYRFEPENEFNYNMAPVEEIDWQTGTFYSSGTNNNSSGGVRTIDYIDVIPGQRYTLQDSSPYASRLLEVQIAEWDGDNRLGITAFVNRGQSHSFTAQGNRIRLGLTPMSGFSIPLDYIPDSGLKMKLEQGNRFTGYEPSPETFTVYNAGNVTIEPESMYLNIFATYVQSTGDFTIRNKTTGEEIILKRNSNRSHFRINGMIMSFGSFTNIFRDTNRRFISLVPGDNEIEVTNGTFEEIRFDFKYLYK